MYLPNYTAWAKEHWEVHLFCVVLAILATIVAYLAEQIGVSVLGVCGLKVSKASFFIQLSISLLYLVILVLSSVLFLKYLKKLGKLEPKPRIFFKYFLVYTILISLNYLLQSASLAVLTVDCFSGISSLAHEIFLKTGNILALGVSIIVTTVIFFHPEFSRSLLPAVLKTFRKTKRTLLLDKNP